ncbi:hypothetical protein B566_EDAN001936 [Ephemera danica]|nr:hypothetical protein B566_EDAN001936 [Ephemera danica]
MMQDRQDIISMGVFSSGKCKSKARLDGKTAVVTGGNNGIGFETSLELLRRGARVIVACRSMERGQAAAERLRAAVSDNAEVRVVRLDLASLKSVKQCAEELIATEPAIHLLINNAGMTTKSPRALTEDGYETVFQTNHLGHFLFTCLLLSKIKDSAPARIINVSSLLHFTAKLNFDDLQMQKSFDGGTAYARSKLCNILFTLELQQRLRGTNVTVYAVHPGGVNTDIVDDAPGCLASIMTRARWALKTPEQGAQTTLHCVTTTGPNYIEDGYETVFQTNHLVGHFMFTCLLLSRIKDSAPARIINVSSLLHFMHPGAVNTDLFDDAGGCVAFIIKRSRWALKTPKQGAQSTLYCALDEKLVEQNGIYFSDCKEARTSSRARNKEDAAKLWQISEELVDTFLPNIMGFIMGIFRNGKCRSKVRLDGKTAVVTGGNNGIGFETSLELLRRGARVIVACRSMERGQAAAERLRAAVSDNADVRLDLASLRSVKQCAEELIATEPAIHLLINNAGIISDSHLFTEDGYETVFQTNHLGHFLFTCLLLSRIKDSAPARIINVSMQFHTYIINFDDLHATKSYSHIFSYAQSKLSNILFTLELQQRLRGTGVMAYALHPGAVNTNIMDKVPGCTGVFVKCVRWSYKTPEQGAQTTLHCALDEKLAEQKGLYYDGCKVARTSSRARNKHHAAKLWQISEEHVATFLHHSIFRTITLRVVLLRRAEILNCIMGVFSNGKCRSKARLDGKTAVVTGGNNGIGFETSLELLRRGTRVIVACRSMERGQAAAERLRTAVSDNAEVRVVRLDLASLKSVKQCAEELITTEPTIHLLINNAGIVGESHVLTEDGYETVFQTNHLGHFLFTCLLLSRIKDSAPARIINVSSTAHKWGKINFNDLHGTTSYSHLSSYAQSKLSNILFTLELQQRLLGTGVVVYSLHPGAVNTDILDEVPGCAGAFVTCARRACKTPEQGAQTTLHCALDEKLAEQKGLYYE